MDKTVLIKEPVIFADTQCDIAENPLWDDKKHILYWRGSKGDLYRKRTNDPFAETESVLLPEIIGGFVLGEHDDELILLGAKGKITGYRWGKDIRDIATVPGSGAGTLINDVIAAPDGSIYFGILTDYFFDPAKQKGIPGTMWQLTPSGDLLLREANAGNIPNGMAFSPDRKKYYFAITDHNCIYEYDYPSLGGKRKFLSLDYCPDGISVDRDGRIWVADCSQHIYCYGPDGALLRCYYFPGIWGITSVAIGEKLYFTTMNHTHAAGFPMGKVYELPIDSKFMPEFRVNF